jgi:hypothetical protein
MHYAIHGHTAAELIYEHAMENIIYNEFRVRGCQVDV